MIKQTNNYVGGTAETGSGGNSTDQLMSSGQIENAVDKGLKVMKRATISAASVGLRKIEVQTLEAHVERRGKLTAQIRAENPSRTEEEVEARLEQFGA
jgi:hypothetical protein